MAKARPVERARRQHLRRGESGRRAERLVFRLALLVVACGSAVVFMLATGLVEPMHFAKAWTASLGIARVVLTTEPTEVIALTIGSLLIGVGALWLLLQPRKPPRRAHLVDADESGIVVVDSDSIEMLATHAAHRAPGVMEVVAECIDGETSALSLRLDVAIHARANPKEAGQRARAIVAETLEQSTGLPVGELVVDVHVIEPKQLMWVA